jgi:hypothetical protein
MATISRTGITDGGTIQPAHITNIIDALDGTSATTTVIATGSFVGTLNGTSSFATNALSASYAANVPVTASYALSALSSSYAVTASVATSASFATTASYALNAGGGAGVGFPFTGSAQVTGSMGITGSLRVGAAALNQYGLLVIGSTFMSGSSVGFVGVLDPNTNITANKNGIINLAGLGGSGFNGKFVLPNNEPEQPVAGAVYWDDAAGRLYVYKESDPPGWTQI